MSFVTVKYQNENGNVKDNTIMMMVVRMTNGTERTIPKSLLQRILDQ